MAYFVTQRTQEIGIRVALGATRGDVLRMVLGQGAKLAAFGVAFGLAGALAAMRGVAALLYEVSPRDPVTLAVLPAVLSMIALIACYVPASRAAKVDPLIALREN